MNPRLKIVDVARRFLDVREVSRNQSPEIALFWDFTDYQEGDDNREPWCCAAVVAWVQMADEESPELNLGRPPKMASTASLLEWAADPRNKCFVFHEGMVIPEAGDIICFRPKLSHVGIVESYADGVVTTIEGNTGPDGGREGDGVYRKHRRLSSFPGCSLIRLPASN